MVNTERLEWLACVLALAGIVSVLAVTGCEIDYKHKFSIEADTPELQAICDERYTVLQLEGRKIRGNVEATTVPAARSDGSFDWCGKSVLGLCITSDNGSSIVKVTKPYRPKVVEHELRHACGQGGLD